MLHAFSASIHGGDAALEPFFCFDSIPLQGIVAGQAGLNAPNLLEMKQMLLCILGFLAVAAASRNPRYGLGIIAMGCRDIGFIQSPVRQMALFQSEFESLGDGIFPPHQVDADPA